MEREQELRRKIEEMKLRIQAKRQIALQHRGRETYLPVKGDEVDERIAQYCNNEQRDTVPVKRLKENEYMFGQLRISTAHDQKTGKVNVNVIKKKDKLDWNKFLKKYEANQLKLLESIKDHEELVVNEDKVLETRKADESRRSPEGLGLKKGARY